jgi:aromatic-ring opening dioxygenase LigAB LigA subunit
MSVNALNRICREVARDHAFRAAMKSDPASAIAGYELTPEERKALLAGDVVTLHNMGVNDFMMGYLARFGSCGLSIPDFNEKIRSVPH